MIGINCHPVPFDRASHHRKYADGIAVRHLSLKICMHEQLRVKEMVAHMWYPETDEKEDVDLADLIQEGAIGFSKCSSTLQMATSRLARLHATVCGCRHLLSIAFLACSVIGPRCGLLAQRKADAAKINMEDAAQSH